MVDAGVFGLKPYVHSDCGGDYRGFAGDLLRWTAHCAFGTIFRYHGADHRPWTYDDHTLQVIKKYLQVRYRLMPSLIAAGHEAAATGFPLVARCDLFWPEHTEARSNDQYIHLKDTLVAPIFSSAQNVTSRNVWVPPGAWQDAWSGSVVTGPITLTTSQPYERQPMWHRRGGLVVMVDDGGVRVDSQDWSKLTLQVFPDFTVASAVSRSVYSQSQVASVSSTALHTGLLLTTTPSTGTSGTLSLDVTASNDGVRRAWVLRLHLLPGQQVSTATVDGVAVKVSNVAAMDSSNAMTPPAFGASGSAPAVGVVAEVQVPSSVNARQIIVTVSN